MTESTQAESQIEEYFKFHPWQKRVISFYIKPTRLTVEVAQRKRSLLSCRLWSPWVVMNLCTIYVLDKLRIYKKKNLIEMWELGCSTMEMYLR